MHSRSLDFLIIFYFTVNDYQLVCKVGLVIAQGDFSYIVHIVYYLCKMVKVEL